MQRGPSIPSATTVLSLAACLTCIFISGQAVAGQRLKPSPALPATPPTSVQSSRFDATAPLASTQPASVAQTPAQRSARRAEVTYAKGRLSVAADNSSLNQILREIGRTTGIKITGGVSDERVFGKYGPAAPAEILATLLDGTGSNVLMIQSDNQLPSELILTPRLGGPTPPNPNAPGFDDDGPADDAPFNGFQPIARPSPGPPSGNAPAGFGGPPNPAANQAAPAQSTPAAAAPSTTDPNDPQSPNGVRTPQQIYEQLQRLRQQTTPAPQ